MPAGRECEPTVSGWLVRSLGRPEPPVATGVPDRTWDDLPADVFGRGWSWGGGGAADRITVSDGTETGLVGVELCGQVVSNHAGAKSAPERATETTAIAGAWAKPALNFQPLPPDNT